MPFPTPPGTRIAYDLDGSVVLLRNPINGQWRDLTPAAVQALNSEVDPTLSWSYSDGAGTWDPRSGDNEFAVVFPVPMRIRGVFLAQTSYNGVIAPAVRTSPNSTNGTDGTWTEILPTSDRGDSPLYSSITRVRPFDAAPAGGQSLVTRDTYRVLSPAATNPRGIRVATGAATRNVRALSFSTYRSDSSIWVRLHIYGEPDVDSTADRVDFWRSDMDARVTPSYLDWGDVPLSSSADKSFRIKNMSAAKTAVSIEISARAPISSTTPAPDQFFTFSLDGGVTWASSLTIASLSPGALSAEIRVRRTVPGTAKLYTWSPRIAAEVRSWS